ncbi:MAG: deoxyribonuclease IV [Candidatus Bathyarchaeia archaeon]
MLGSNVPAHPARGGLATLFRYAEEWRCECAQTYITLSRRWDVSDLTPGELFNFKAAWRESKVKQVIVHAPLLVNLASPLDDIWQKSKDRLSTELSRANKLGIQFLVLHPGYYRNLDKKRGVKRIIEALDNVLDNVNDSTVMILLETTAGQGTAVGSRFEEIAYILEKTRKEHFLGVCLDTCHVFAAGYDIRGYLGYEKVLKKFDIVVGLDKLKVIHLNDSKTRLGSKVDRHASIGEGKMGLQIFHAFVKDPRFRDTPKVLEIPERKGKKVQQQLELLRRLQATSNLLSEPEGIRAQQTLDEVL